MHYIHRDVKRYFLLLGIVILAGFAVYFQSAKDHVFKALLHEKVIAVEHDVNYICDTLNFLVAENGWEVEKYKDALMFLTEQLDATPNIYAELCDDQFNTLSHRIIPVDDSWAFNPRWYPDFVSAVQSADSGQYTISHPQKDAPPLIVYLHWRWIPTGSYENKVLLSVGVTQYSVDTKLADWLTYGILALFFTATVFIVGSIMLLSVDRRKVKR